MSLQSQDISDSSMSEAPPAPGDSINGEQDHPPITESQQGEKLPGSPDDAKVVAKKGSAVGEDSVLGDLPSAGDGSSSQSPAGRSDDWDPLKARKGL